MRGSKGAEAPEPWAGEGYVNPDSVCQPAGRPRRTPSYVSERPARVELANNCVEGSHLTARSRSRVRAVCRIRTAYPAYKAGASPQCFRRHQSRVRESNPLSPHTKRARLPKNITRQIVEAKGIEPSSHGLQSRRFPRWATPPWWTLGELHSRFCLAEAVTCYWSKCPNERDPATRRRRLIEDIGCARCDGRDFASGRN